RGAGVGPLGLLHGRAGERVGDRRGQRARERRDRRLRHVGDVDGPGHIRKFAWPEPFAQDIRLTVLALVSPRCSTPGVPASRTATPSPTSSPAWRPRPGPSPRRSRARWPTCRRARRRSTRGSPTTRLTPRVWTSATGGSTRAPSRRRLVALAA